MSAERRGAERLETLVQVEIHHGGDVTSLPVENVSAGGMLVRNDARIDVAVGEDVIVFIYANDIAVTMGAAVVRCDGTNIAVTWTSNEDPRFLQLLQLVRERSG